MTRKEIETLMMLQGEVVKAWLEVLDKQGSVSDDFNEVVDTFKRNCDMELAKLKNQASRG